MLENAILEKNNQLSGMNNEIVNKLDEIRQEFESEILKMNQDFDKLYNDKYNIMEEELIQKDDEVYELHAILNELRPKYEDEKRKLIDKESQVLI